MYLELLSFVMFCAFCGFAVLDAKYREIKMYWFVGLAVFVVLYKIVFALDYIVSDIMMFSVSAIFVFAAYIARLFGAADLLGILILSFAVPNIGPIPTGLPVLIVTLIVQTWGITISNASYNISDIIHDRQLFADISRQKTRHKLYWFFLARRRRTNDRFIISAQKSIDKPFDSISDRMNPDSTFNGTFDGTFNGTSTTPRPIVLSIRRDNKLTDTTKYVYSAHPQFVYSTISFAIIWFFATGIRGAVS